MLSLWWWLPLAVAAAGIAPLWRGARRLSEEEARLQASIAELGLLRPVVEQVRAEIAAVGTTERSIPDLGRR